MVVFDNFYFASESSKINGTPFSNFETKGFTKWVKKFGNRTKAPDVSDRKVLYLDDVDFITKKSGAVTLTVAQGYRVTLEVLTENNKYFTDNTKTPLPAKNNGLIETINLFDEKITLVMFGGDYLSIDVDEEHSGIFRYRLQLNGEFYNVSNPEKVNNEVWIEMIEARLEDGSGQEVVFDDDNFIELSDDEVVITDPQDDEIDDENDDENDEKDDDDSTESQPLSFKGLLIIGAVVIGIVLLLRYGRKGSNSTKSSSGEGGASSE